MGLTTPFCPFSNQKLPHALSVPCYRWPSVNTLLIKLCLCLPLSIDLLAFCENASTCLNIIAKPSIVCLFFSFLFYVENGIPWLSLTLLSWEIPLEHVISVTLPTYWILYWIHVVVIYFILVESYMIYLMHVEYYTLDSQRKVKRMLYKIFCHSLCPYLGIFPSL